MKKIIYLLIIGITYSCMPATDSSNSSSTVDSLTNALIDSANYAQDSMKIWEVRYYVDEFNEPTNEGYITTKEDIYGTFSNSATQNSNLIVRFLISNGVELNIMLFEYAGTNPVKTGLEDSYTVKVKHNDSEPIVITATNYSDRLSFSKSASKKVTDMLLQGGKLNFYIVENTEYSSSEYKFKIDDCSGFDKALNHLKKKK